MTRKNKIRLKRKYGISLRDDVIKTGVLFSGVWENVGREIAKKIFKKDIKQTPYGKATEEWQRLRRKRR